VLIGWVVTECIRQDVHAYLFGDGSSGLALGLAITFRRNLSWNLYISVSNLSMGRNNLLFSEGTLVHTTW
jgi:hypothetical protein